MYITNKKYIKKKNSPIKCDASDRNARYRWKSDCPQRDRDRFILLRGSKRKETWRENRYRVIIINGKCHVGGTFRFDRKLWCEGCIYARGRRKFARRWQRGDARNMHLRVERIVLSEKKRREERRRKKKERKEKRSWMFLRDWSNVDPRIPGGCSFVVLESCLESKHVRVLRRMDENRYLDYLPSKEKNFFQQDKICVLHIYIKKKKEKNLSLQRMAFLLALFSFN